MELGKYIRAKRSMLNRKGGLNTPINVSYEVGNPNFDHNVGDYSYKAEGGRVIGKPGGLVEPGVHYYGKKVVIGQSEGSDIFQTVKSKDNKGKPYTTKQTKKFKYPFKGPYGTVYHAEPVDRKIEQTTQRIQKFENIKKSFDKAIETGDYAWLNSSARGQGKMKQQYAQVLNALEAGTPEFSDFAKRMDLDENTLETMLKERKEYTEQSRVKSTRRGILGKVKNQKTIMEVLEKGPSDLKILSKKTGLTQKATKEELRKLLQNIYAQRVQIGKGKYAVKNNWSIFLPNDENKIDNLLKNFWNTEGIPQIKKDTIGDLFYKAYGKQFLPDGKTLNPTYNPNKYRKVLNKLNEYNVVKDFIENNFDLKLDLDHPLDRSALTSINATPDQMVRVTPVSRSINRGLKEKIQRKINTVNSELKTAKGDDLLKLQNQKKGLNNLVNYLELETGKISPSGKVVRYGVDPFETIDLRKEIVENLSFQNELAAKVKTPEFKDLTKAAGVESFSFNVPEIKTSVINKIKTNPQLTKNLLKVYKQCGNAGGGEPVDTAVCLTKNLLKDSDMIKTGNATQRMVAGNRYKTVLNDVKKGAGKFMDSPVGKGLKWLELGLEVPLEGLLVGWDMAFNAKPLDEAINDNTLIARSLVSALPEGELKQKLGGGWKGKSGEELRMDRALEGNDAAQRYYNAKKVSDEYNRLRDLVRTYETDPEAKGSGLYDRAVKDLQDYEQEIDFLMGGKESLKRILTPGSYEANEFERARLAQASERTFETYGKAEEMELMDPLEGAFDSRDMQQFRAEEFQDQVDSEDLLNKQTQEQFINQYQEPFIKFYSKQIYGKELKPGENALVDSLAQQALKEQYEKDLDLFRTYEAGFKKGGRVGFKKGGLTRRGFLKLVGGIGALVGAVKTGLVKLKTPVAKQVLKDAPTGTPDWFAPLVDKIMREGVDAGQTMKTVTGRETVKKLEVPAPGSDGAITDKYYVFHNPDTGEIRVDIDAPAIGANGEEFSLYMRPDRVEGIADNGMPMINEGEFLVNEQRATGVQSGPDDWDMELLETYTDLEGSASDWHAVEKFATGKTDEAAQVKKQKFKNEVESDPTQDIINRQGEYDYPGPDVDDYE